MSVAGAIKDAFLSEHPFYFSTEGIVKKVEDKTCDIALQNNSKFIYKDVRWYSPVKPSVGSKCLLIFRDNKDERVVATNFAELDSIKTTIGKLTDISISDEGVEIVFSSTAKISLDSTSAILELGSNSVEITNSKIKISGDVEINGKLNATGNIESDAEVSANKSSTPTHLSKSKTATAIPGPPAPLTPG